MTDNTLPTSRVPSGVPTGGQFAASARAEANVGLSSTPVTESAPTDDIVWLDEPVVRTYPDGSRLEIHVAGPFTVEDMGISYGGVCTGGRSNYIKPTLMDRFKKRPPRNIPFSGSVGGPGRTTMARYSGFARTHEEGWARLDELGREFADEFDRRPSVLRLREEMAAWEKAQAASGPDA